MRVLLIAFALAVAVVVGVMFGAPGLGRDLAIAWRHWIDGMAQDLAGGGRAPPAAADVAATTGSTVPAPAAPAPAPAGAPGSGAPLPSPSVPPSAPPVPVQPASQPRPVAPLPNGDVMAMLIRGHLLALNQANISGDYSVLRDLAAPGFREANNPARLTEIFTELRARNLDMSPVSVINPQLIRPPAIDDQGYLRLTGFVPSRPQQINFDLAFELVGNRWRLFGIAVQAVDAPPEAASAPGGVSTPSQPASLRVQARPDPSAKPPKGAAAKPAVPDAAGQAALIRAAVMALGQANLTGNYGVLREISSPGFREANTLVKLVELFAALRARDLDLSPTLVIGPQLVTPASIDKSGYLRLTGVFPSRPEQVNFDLAFQWVGGEWRLFGIGLNTSREEPAAAAAAPPGGPGNAPGQAGQGPAPVPGGAGTSATPAPRGPAPTPRTRPPAPPPG